MAAANGGGGAANNTPATTAATAGQPMFKVLCSGAQLVHYIRNSEALPDHTSVTQCFEAPRSVAIPTGGAVTLNCEAISWGLSRFNQTPDTSSAEVLLVVVNDASCQDPFGALGIAPTAANVVSVNDVRWPPEPSLTALSVNSSTGEGIDQLLQHVAGLCLRRRNGGPVDSGKVNQEEEAGLATWIHAGQQSSADRAAALIRTAVLRISAWKAACDSAILPSTHLQPYSSTVLTVRALLHTCSS